MIITDINSYPLSNDPYIISFTISKNNWNSESKLNEVQFSGDITLYLNDSPGYIKTTSESSNIINSSNIRISKLETNKIIFECDTIPTEDIEAKLYYNTKYSMVPSVDGFLPLSGGTMSGNIYMKPTNNISLYIDQSGIHRGNNHINLSLGSHSNPDIDIKSDGSVNIYALNTTGHDSTANAPMISLDRNGTFNIRAKDNSAYIESTMDGAISIRATDSLRLFSDSIFEIHNAYDMMEEGEFNTYNSKLKFAGDVHLLSDRNINIESNQYIHIQGTSGTNIKDSNGETLLQIRTDTIKLRNSQGTNLLVEGTGIVSELESHTFRNKDGGDVALILDRDTYDDKGVYLDNTNANWRILSSASDNSIHIQTDYHNNSKNKDEYIDILRITGSSTSGNPYIGIYNLASMAFVDGDTENATYIQAGGMTTPILHVNEITAAGMVNDSVRIQNIDFSDGGDMNNRELKLNDLGQLTFDDNIIDGFITINASYSEILSFFSMLDKSANIALEFNDRLIENLSEYAITKNHDLFDCFITTKFIMFNTTPKLHSGANGIYAYISFATGVYEEDYPGEYFIDRYVIDTDFNVRKYRIIYANEKHYVAHIEYIKNNTIDLSITNDNGKTSDIDYLKITSVSTMPDDINISTGQIYMIYE